MEIPQRKTGILFRYCSRKCSGCSYMYTYKSLFLQLLLSLSLMVGAVQANEACLLRVFSQYCLGGDIIQLSRHQPSFIHQQREGERFALIYPAGVEKDYVMAYRDRIYKVLRKFDPSTSNRYREWRDLLTMQYGRPIERSWFPAQATGLAAKISAIKRGEGQALLSWYPQTSPWHIELGWTKEMGLYLAYIITQERFQQTASGDPDQ